MKLKNLYQEIIKQGIEADCRSAKEIEQVLKIINKQYQGLSVFDKEFFDQDSLFNPFSDTRIICGESQTQIKSLIVGIDIDTCELLLVDRLKEKGKKIDLVISHHPLGRAYAHFYEVMDLQVDVYTKEGISLSAAESYLSERKQEVKRKVHAANHQRSVDAANFLGMNVLCMHTPCDNLAFKFINQLMRKEKPKNLGQISDILYQVPEYKISAKNNNPPLIASGSRNSRVAKIHLEFTGGTEGPKDIYARLSACGVDTIIAMHQSEEHFKRAQEAKINVIFAPHIASDNLGVNLMLDFITKKEKIKIYEFSGFRRVKR